MENLDNLKEVGDSREDQSKSQATAVTWYQTLEECQQIAIVGFKKGDVMFIDLATGIKLCTVYVVGEITDLKVCIDNGLDSIFLVVRTYSFFPSALL